MYKFLKKIVHLQMPGFLLLMPFSAMAESILSGNFYSFYESGATKNLTTKGLGGSLLAQSKLGEQWQTQIEFIGEKDFADTNASIGEIRNLYGEWKNQYVTARLGWQTIDWEGTDIFNPADVINSKNYTRPMTPISRASPTLRVSAELNSFEWDMILIPRKSGNAYPNNKNYWLPRNKRILVDSGNTEIIIPDSIDYELRPPIILSEANKDNFGTRLNYRGLSLDIGLFYFEGANTSGTLILEGVPQEVFPKSSILLTSPIAVTPIEYKQKTYGLTVTKPFLDSWILRLSGAYTQPLAVDERVPKPQDTAVVAFEKSSTIFKKSVITSLAVYRIRKSDINQVTLLRSVFANALSFSGRLEVSEESSWLWAFVFDLLGKSNLSHLEWSYRINNLISIGASTDQFEGPPETLIGSYSNFDIYRAFLKLSF